MANRIAYPCIETGCRQDAVRLARCAPHARQHERAYDSRRGTPRQRGYDETWKRLRDDFLRMHPLCQQCVAKGIRVSARYVHHVASVKQRPDRRLDSQNLRALCARCHQRAHRSADE